MQYEPVDTWNNGSLKYGMILRMLMLLISMYAQNCFNYYRLCGWSKKSLLLCDTSRLTALNLEELICQQYINVVINNNIIIDLLKVDKNFICKCVVHRSVTIIISRCNK
ncbi:hypothetical protein ACJX0J_028030 [Zea mays]